MPNKDKLSEPTSSTDTIDLDALNSLNFGPSWADSSTSSIKKTRKATKASSYGDQKSSKFNKRVKKDRRAKSNFRQNEFASRNQNNDGHTYSKKPSLLKNFDIKVYPQDDTFDALIKQLRIDCKTYQLFELTQIILEKPERFVVLINRIENNESSNPIYFCPKDKIPFDTKEEAIEHFYKNFISDFYEITDIEIDAPKGDFKSVYRCPFTQTLLSPPNYHLFQDILKSHHKSHIKGMNLADYQNKLICENDLDAVKEWSEKMKKAHNFKLISHQTNQDNKDESDGDQSTESEIKNADIPKIEFNSKEQAINYLLSNQEDLIIRKCDNFRLNGALLSSLPKGIIKDSILNEIQTQKRFPLDSANNIRGRLRRHKFTIYKKGSKGVSYVCSVKRKFRDSTTVFTESISELITYIESNQGMSIHALPYNYLGIEKPIKSKISKPCSTQGCEDTPKSLTEESNPPARDNLDIPEPDKEKFKEIIQNLRWLISEGYVTEYSNNKVFVNPILEPSNPKNDSADSINEEVVSKDINETNVTPNKKSSRGNQEENK